MCAAIVHLDDPPDDVAVAAEARCQYSWLRTSVAGASCAVVFGSERAAEERRDAERLEVVPRHDAGGHPLGLVAAEQDEIHVVILDDGVERGASGA